MLLIDMRDQADRVVTARVDVSQDMVEFRVEDRLVGVADRLLLHSWLLRPQGRFSTDKLELRVVPAGLAISIADYVRNWVLGWTDLWQLYNMLDN